ncbi:hypothetical protein GN244_ATG00009 [Phytophthora infestans]|uniref:Uncharacterized protein n=1 Tax=Phytophthora infestans TaxID=4787 RepID=A0A833TI94_PHYIN|nr:hypothetical protein GN244_ATG00009 [Phytophthora infestans]KAF4144865.1 hypothetical protein GN958_ATG06033 [Phytophthora infestans]
MDQRLSDTGPFAEEESENELHVPSGIDEPERKRAEDEPRPSRQAAISSRLGSIRSRGPSKSPMELHRRCAETIERCSATLRERQRKMERLQLLLPLPNSSLHKENNARASPPTRCTPPRPTKRNKLGSTTPVLKRDKHSHGVRSPAWSMSSTKAKISTRLSFDDMATSPLTNRHSNNQTQIRNTVLDAPDTSRNSRHATMYENDKTATQESTPTSHSEGTPEPSSIDTSTNSPRRKAMVISPTWSQRQQNFMAAIEAEADSTNANE